MLLLVEALGVMVTDALVVLRTVVLLFLMLAGMLLRAGILLLDLERLTSRAWLRLLQGSKYILLFAFAFIQTVRSHF
jgi:hypothetical protein